MRGTLMPLSTFMRGARVAVMKNRPQGLQPWPTAQCDELLPMRFNLFLHRPNQEQMHPCL